MIDYTKIAVSLFDRYANQYQEKYMNVDLYKKSFDIFCTNIKKKNATVLELACGPGNITKYLLEKRPDFKLYGIDLSIRMINLAKSNNPSAKFEVMDCRDIYALKKKYDAIMCGFCLPYLSKSEAIKIIEDCNNSLANNGLLYLSTMEDDNDKSGLKQTSQGDFIFINYHQKDYITEALIKNNFKIIEIQQNNFPTEDKTKVIDLIIIARKK